MPDPIAPARERSAYGRCAAIPQIRRWKNLSVLEFDLTDPDRDRVFTVLARVPDEIPEDAVARWIQDIAEAGLVQVCGLFRFHYAGRRTGKAWRILATQIRILPHDNGQRDVNGPKDFARSRASHPSEIEDRYPTRSLDLKPAFLKPLQRHKGGFAIAFEGAKKGTPYDVVHPITDTMSANDVVRLSAEIIGADRVSLTGYFRPAILRNGTVLRWGFVANTVSVVDGPKPKRPGPSMDHVRPQIEKPERSSTSKTRPVKNGQPRPILTGLSEDERRVLTSLRLDQARFTPQIRDALTRLGCNTLCDVADLNAEQILKEHQIGPRKLTLARQALRDALLHRSVRKGMITITQGVSA